jgi:hypothetical protein
MLHAACGMYNRRAIPLKAGVLGERATPGSVGRWTWRRAARRSLVSRPRHSADGQVADLPGRPTTFGLAYPWAGPHQIPVLRMIPASGGRPDGAAHGPGSCVVVGRLPHREHPQRAAQQPTDRASRRRPGTIDRPPPRTSDTAVGAVAAPERTTGLHGHPLDGRSGLDDPNAHDRPGRRAIDPRRRGPAEGSGADR